MMYIEFDGEIVEVKYKDKLTIYKVKVKQKKGYLYLSVLTFDNNELDIKDKVIVVGDQLNINTKEYHRKCYSFPSVYAKSISKREENTEHLADADVEVEEDPF